MVIKPIISSVTFIVVSLLLSGCTKHESFHGYSFDQRSIQQIHVGKTTKEELLSSLGAPTSTPNFRGNTYYYISMHQEGEAFFLPHTVAQDVLEINFDSNDVVSNMKSYSLSEARNIEYAATRTKLVGNEITPLEQIFNNLGKFNAPKQKPRY